MRQIKFRAWDTIDKRMRYENDVDGIKEFPSLLAVGFHGLPISITPDSFKETEIIGWNRDHNLILMQFTGLLDRNGKEVYEGDIVDFCDFDHDGADYLFKGVVKFNRGRWEIWRTWDDEFYGSDGAFYLYGVHQNDDNFEVIGSVYEHPELLETK